MGRQFPATAANIISSLGVKGAIGKIPAGAQGSSFGGFIPILNEDGKIDLSFIPPGAAEMSVQRLHNVAIVDPMTTGTVRTGSVIAPFKDIAEAAASITPDEGYNVANRCAILLMPGKYDDSLIEFASNPFQAFIICAGQCVWGRSTVAISGMQHGSSLTIQNVFTEGSISVSNCTKVTCRGETSIGGSLTLAQGAALWLSPDSFVASTNASSVSYLSSASRVGNDSKVVGVTVADALGTLGKRAIRVANITSSESGFDYDEDDFTDVSALPAGTIEVYDLRGRDKAFVDGVNRLVAMWQNPTVGTLTANTVKADSVIAGELKIDAVTLGGYKLTIDPYGYLVVVDGSEPVNPPQGVVLIRDSETNEVFILGIANGRMYVAKDESEESAGVVDSITVQDPTTGQEYSVTMYGGRLMLSTDDEGVSGPGTSETEDSQRKSKLYAMDETSGKCYRVVAVVDPDTREVGLGVAQQGVEPYV